MAKKLQVDVNAGEIIESFRPDLPRYFSPIRRRKSVSTNRMYRNR